MYIGTGNVQIKWKLYTPQTFYIDIMKTKTTVVLFIKYHWIVKL